MADSQLILSRLCFKDFAGCGANMNGSYLMEGRELKPLRSSKGMQGSPSSNMSDIITMKSGLGIPIGFVPIEYRKKASLLYERLATAGP